MHATIHTRYPLFTVFAILGILSACKDGGEAPSVADLEVPEVVQDVAGDSVPVQVRVLDASGVALSGVSVRFTPSGGGSAQPQEVRSNDEGFAATSWTLGTQAGTQNLLVKAGDFSYSLSATVDPSEPAALVLVSGGNQSAQAGAPLGDPVRIVVRDRFGNAVPGVAVTVTPSEEDASVSSSVIESDSTGAGQIEWTLGGEAGPQALSLQFGSLVPLTVSATAVAGPFAKLEKFAGNRQTSTVGGTLGASVVVRTTDVFGNSVSGVLVAFHPSSTSGTVDLSEVTSDIQGHAHVQWTLGTSAGQATLLASAAPAEPVTFEATAAAGPPASLEEHGGDDQTSVVNTTLPEPISVRVQDAFGNPVAGASVEFSASSGHGTVSPETGTTDSGGVARATWTLGGGSGSQSATATLPEVGSVTFNAVATSGGGGGGGGGGSSFNLEVRFVGTPTAVQAAAFENARVRWSNVITGDLPNAQVTIGQDACGVEHPAMNEVVDDLVIWVVLESIDGPGGVLGSAGPCMVRGGSFLPVVGGVRLDSDDLSLMESTGTLEDVILHEMGHVLGIGTLWSTKALLAGAGGADPHFTGSAAQNQYSSMGGSAPNPVPVENTGGPGTRDSHWRESDLGSELMTGWIGAGSNPLSALTVGSLSDMGFVVNFGAADGMSLAPSGFQDRVTEFKIQVKEVAFAPPMIVGGAGGSGGRDQ